MVDVSAKREQTGPGRPVTVRFSPAELDQLDRLAGRHRLGRSGVIRSAVDALDAATDGRRADVAPAPADRALTDAYIALRAELRRIGNNVNQIARKVHTGAAPSADMQAATDDLARTFGDIWWAVTDAGGSS